jgi:hypothetical protein
MRYDVWWRRLGNRDWHLIPGVLADSATDAVVDQEFDTYVEAYAYPRERRKRYRITSGGVVKVR